MPPVARPLTTCWRNSCMGRLVAEVGAAYGLLTLQLRTGALDRDAADLEHISVSRELECDECVLLDEQDGHAVRLVDGADDLEDRAHDHRRKTERRLVEEHQLWPHEKDA